ncbi:DNA mismatch repair protein MSH1, mitochondrial [Glycine soja]
MKITHHRGSNKKSNESYKSTESMEEIVIPGDIPELDSLVVYEKELCSDFFSNGTGCLEPSGERRKKNGHKSCNKDESHDLNKSITDFVIPGDVPAIDSLMVVLERDACQQYKMFKAECIYQTEKLTSKFYRRWPSSTKRNSQGTPAKKKNQQESFLIFVVVIINHGTFSENFHSHSCFLSKLWQRLQMCRKLSTVQLTERLGYSNLSGLNSNMKNGRKEHLTGKCCNSSQNFHVKVLLCRVGEFYEAWGINVCILVEYEGLNPFGGLQSDSIMRAGCWYFYFCRQTFILMLPFVLGTCVFIVKMRWKI